MQGMHGKGWPVEEFSSFLEIGIGGLGIGKMCRSLLFSGRFILYIFQFCRRHISWNSVDKITSWCWLP